jgi:hypothetical protein
LKYLDTSITGIGNENTMIGIGPDTGWSFELIVSIAVSPKAIQGMPFGIKYSHGVSRTNQINSTLLL